MHNPAAAHPRLLALLDGMAQIEQGATEGRWTAQPDDALNDFVQGDLNWCVCDENEHIIIGGISEGDAKAFALSRNALPPLLAFLRAEAEYHVERYDFYIAPYASQIMAVHRDAHARICTTALAAAAGTPALAVLAGELQGAME